MSQTISRWQLGGFLFTSVLGTALHFFFELTGGSAGAALVSAVNESIWEHMKLIYYPMVLFAGLQALFRRPVPETFWCIKLASVSLGLVLVPVLYYSYTGILGIMVNKDELDRMGLEAPQTWDDLTKPEYEGLIMLSNPNTAGTAKLVINTMIQKYGHDEGIQYLVDLDKNHVLIVKELESL